MNPSRLGGDRQRAGRGLDGRRAEEIGDDQVACSGAHRRPATASNVRGRRSFDPFSTLGYFSAPTSGIGPLTHMVVVPYHHRLELLERPGTLDVLSVERVIAGVGAGSLEPEFELLGHDSEDRGETHAARSAEGTRDVRRSLKRSGPVPRGCCRRERQAEDALNWAFNAGLTTLPVALRGRASTKTHRRGTL